MPVSRKNRFFLYMIVLFPIIDFLNGYLLYLNQNLSVGILYRFFVIVYLLVSIFFQKLKRNNYTLLTFLFIFLITSLQIIQSIFLELSMDYFIEDFSSLMKLFLWCLIPYYIYQNKEEFRKSNYHQLFILISLFFTLGMLIPYFLGVGRQTYENSDAGYKAFFFATNDTTIAFMVSSTFTGWTLISTILKKKYLFSLFLSLLYLGNMVSFVLLATKTGIFYGIAATLWFVLLFLFKQGDILMKNKFLIAGISLFVISIILIFNWDFILQSISGTIARINYFYKLFNGDLIRLLSSSRSDYLAGGWEIFTNSKHLLYLFIGFGFQYRVANFGRLGLIEMDFFDALFSLGIIGAAAIFLLLCYFLMIAVKKKKMTIYSSVYIIMLLYGFFAGHVFFSALSTTFLGLICGGMILEIEDDVLE